MYRKLTSLVLAALITAVAAPVANAADVNNLRQDKQALERARASSGNAADPGFRSALGLSGNEGLEVIRKSNDGRGGIVTRYRQTYRGVPVWGEQIVVGRDASGKVRSLNGRLVADIATELQQLTPILGSEDALQAMKDRVKGRLSDKEQVFFKNEQSELVIYLDNGAPRLSQAVSFFADTAEGGKPTRPTFIVDAETGEILFEFEGLTHNHCGATCLVDQDNLSSKPRRWKYFTVPVLTEDGVLRIALSGGSGDADLYIQKDRNPTTSDYACQSITPTADEACSVQAKAGESWRIGIYAYSSYRGVDLSARLGNSTPVAGTGPGGNEKIGQHYYGTDFLPLDVVDLGDNSGTCTMETINVKTVDLNHGTSGSSAYEYVCPENTKKFINGAFSPLNDAHYFGGVVFDMYNAWVGGPPLDFQLTMRVHYSNNYENAFWNGSSMTFGDGASTFYPLVSLDVAAHEVSHGFTEQNSNLIYSGESGGINEAFSDIAGEAAENFSRGSNDFDVGYDIFKDPSGALRYMCNPTLDGRSIDHLDYYYSGLDVHYSSGLFNKAFCELVQTSGWSVRQAFETFARANQLKWTPSTGFVEGAQGVVDVASEQGWTPSDVQAAFQVVGITTVLPGPGGDTTDPTVSINNAPYSVSSIAPFNVTVQFSEDVTGFEENDVSVTNGSTAGFTLLDGSTYTVAIMPNGNDDIAINIGAGAAQDLAGNNNTAASEVTVAYVPPPPAGDIMHASLTASGTPGSRGKWNAEVTILIADVAGPVEGAVVTGSWSNGANGNTSCTTDASGECRVAKSNLRGTSVTFTVIDISFNSRPWVVENGSSITVDEPGAS